MALTISATDVELPKPVNNVFIQTFLRRARVLCPYFVGTKPGMIEKNSGTLTAKWRRFTNLATAITPLAELAVEASYMQGRSAAALAVTDITATVAKYGNFVILNEESSMVNFNGQTDEIFDVMGENAGHTLDQLQRNEVEDNSTLVYAGGNTADANQDSAITRSALQSVINTLSKNSAKTFTPRNAGSNRVGSTPVLPGFWGITHPDVAIDIADMAGFKGVETYAGHVSTVMGEFGLIQAGGLAVRFIQTEDASVDAGAGPVIGSTGLNGTTNVDLYTTVIFGREAVGSLGFGKRHTDGSFEAGDELGPVEIIHNALGTGKTSDPFKEIETIAWKAWHIPKILNTTWIRGIRSGATKLNT